MERIISFGRPLLDITAIIESNQFEDIYFAKERRLVELQIEDIKKKALKFFVSVGGVESNVALNCAFLGLKSCLIGSVGEDILNNMLKGYSKKYKEFESHVQVFPKEKSGIIFIVCDEKGRRKKFVDYGASENFSWNKKTRKKLQESTIFFTSVFSANSPNLKSLWKKSLVEAKNTRKKVVVNLGGIDLVWDKKEIIELINKYAAVVTMNDVEKHIVELFFGKKIITILSLPNTIIVTNGTGKINVYDKEENFSFSPKCVHDTFLPFTIGVGDALTAGFLVAQAKGKNTREAAIFAEKIARKKLTKSCSNLLSEL